MDNIVKEDHGRSFKARIDRTEISGIIFVEHGVKSDKFYLCQNKKSGSRPTNYHTHEFYKKYKYTWQIGNGDIASLPNFNVHDFKFTDVKKDEIKIGNVYKVTISSSFLILVRDITDHLVFYSDKKTDDTNEFFSEQVCIQSKELFKNLIEDKTYILQRSQDPNLPVNSPEHILDNKATVQVTLKINSKVYSPKDISEKAWLKIRSDYKIK